MKQLQNLPRLPRCCSSLVYSSWHWRRLSGVGGTADVEKAGAGALPPPVPPTPPLLLAVLPTILLKLDRFILSSIPRPPGAGGGCRIWRLPRYRGGVPAVFGLALAGAGCAPLANLSWPLGARAKSLPLAAGGDVKSRCRLRWPRTTCRSHSALPCGCGSGSGWSAAEMLRSGEHASSSPRPRSLALSVSSLSGAAGARSCSWLLDSAKSLLSDDVLSILRTRVACNTYSNGVTRRGSRGSHLPLFLPDPPVCHLTSLILTFGLFPPPRTTLSRTMGLREWGNVKPFQVASHAHALGSTHNALQNKMKAMCL